MNLFGGMNSFSRQNQNAKHQNKYFSSIPENTDSNLTITESVLKDQVKLIENQKKKSQSKEILLQWNKITQEKLKEKQLEVDDFSKQNKNLQRKIADISKSLEDQINLAEQYKLKSINQERELNSLLSGKKETSKIPNYSHLDQQEIKSRRKNVKNEESAENKTSIEISLKSPIYFNDKSFDLLAENKILQEENTELRKKIDKLLISPPKIGEKNRVSQSRQCLEGKSKIYSLKSFQCTEETEEIAKLKDQNKTLYRQLLEKDNEIAEFHLKIKELQKKISEYNAKLRLADISNKELEQRHKKLTEELSYSTEEICKLINDNKELKAHENNYARLLEDKQKIINNLLTEITNNNRELDEDQLKIPGNDMNFTSRSFIRDDEINPHRCKLMMKDEEIEEINERNEVEIVKLKRSHEEFIKEKNITIGELKRKYEEIVMNSEIFRIRFQEKEEEIKERDQEIKDKIKIINEVTAEKEGLKDRLQETLKIRTSLERKLKEHADLIKINEGKLIKLQTINESLKSGEILSYNESLDLQNSLVRSNDPSTQHANSQLKTENLEKKLKDMEDEYRLQVIILDNKNQELAEHMKALKLNLSKSIEEIDKLNKNYQTLKIEYEEIIKKNQENISSLELNNQSLKENKEKLENQQNKSNEFIREIEENLSSQRKKVAKLEEQLILSTKENKDLMRKLANADDANEDLSKSLSSAHFKIKTLELEKSNLENELVEQQTLESEFKILIENHTKSKSMDENSLEKDENNIVRLKTFLCRMKENLEKYEEELEYVCREQSSDQKLVKILEDSNITSEKDAKMEEEEIISLKKEIEAGSKNLEQIIKERDENAKKNLYYEDCIKQLKEDLNEREVKIRDYIEKLNNEMNETEVMMRNIETENETLKEKLNLLENEYNNLHQSKNSITEEYKAAINEKNEELRKKADLLEKLKKSTEALSREKDEIEEQLEEAESAKVKLLSTVGEANTRISCLEAQIIKYKCELENVLNECDRVSQLMKKLSNENKEIIMENMQLHESLIALESELGKARVSLDRETNFLENSSQNSIIELNEKLIKEKESLELHLEIFKKTCEKQTVDLRDLAEKSSKFRAEAIKEKKLLLEQIAKLNNENKKAQELIRD